MTRMETLLTSMNLTMPAPCHHITAAIAVVKEYPSSPVRIRVAAEIAALAIAQREVCRCYNNLRSLVGTLEREQGNPSPVFYEGKIRTQGERPISECNCGVTPLGDNTNGIVNT